MWAWIQETGPVGETAGRCKWVCVCVGGVIRAHNGELAAAGAKRHGGEDSQLQQEL